MEYELIIADEAVLDLQVAFGWYESRRIGLGDELIEEVEACFKMITKTPDHYTFINNRYRRIKTKRFPYLIVYEVMENKVVVYNVLHAKRKI